MSSLLVRIDPVTVKTTDTAILAVLQALHTLNASSPGAGLTQASFVSRLSSPNTYDFAISSNGRTWSSVVVFASSTDTDPSISFTAPDGWHDTELGLLRIVRETMVRARVQKGITAFDVSWQTQSSPGVSIIELDVSPGSLVHGTPVSLSWLVPLSSQGSNVDWIGLFAVGSPNTAYLSYVFVAGQTNGEHDFPTTTLPPGSYEFRYLLNNGYTDVARSVPFVVS